MTKKLKIDSMFAFLAEEEDGEGVCAFYDARQGVWLPMVGADWDRVESLKTKAKELAARSGMQIRLVKFSNREQLEVIKP